MAAGFSSSAIEVSVNRTICDLGLTLLSETDSLPELVSRPNVTIVPLAPPPRWLQTSNKLLFLLLAPLKVLLQTWGLWRALAYSTPACKWMLVQVRAGPFLCRSITDETVRRIRRRFRLC